MEDAGPTDGACSTHVTSKGDVQAPRSPTNCGIRASTADDPPHPEQPTGTCTLMPPASRPRPACAAPVAGPCWR